MTTLVKKSTADVGQAVCLGIGLTLISYMIGFSWIDRIDYLEAFAVATAYTCTWLCVKQRRINYPIGALSTAAFSLLFWRADLVASAVLNLYLTPQLIYGWFRWRKDTITRPVTHVEPWTIPVYLASTGLFFGGALFLVNSLDGKLAFWDCAILVGSILAQFLLDNKKIETWFVWAIVNVIAISVYAKAGLTITAVQYFLFLGNSIIGYNSWRKTCPQHMS